MEDKKGYNRRDFLKVLGASGGVAMAGCGKELPEKLIPYVVQPDEVIPGVASWYTGSCQECSAGCGVLVRTREGRAVKVEGNPDHPVNAGGLCARGQSSVQGHYDPDRVREPLKRKANGAFAPISWKEAIDTVAEALKAVGGSGKEVALLSKSLSGSEAQLAGEFLGKAKNGKHFEFDLFSRRDLDAAAEQVFGKGLTTHFDFSKAEVIVGFGADYLETWLSPVEFTKGFSKSRLPDSHGKISKAYHIEPRLSLTAANADTWLKNNPKSELSLLRALLKSLLLHGAGKKSPRASGAASAAVANASIDKLLAGSGVSKEQIEAIAKDLIAAKTSLVVAGGASVVQEQRKDAAVVANLINALLDNVGKTLLLRDAPVVPAGLEYNSTDKLLASLEADKVGVLMTYSANPVFSLSGKSALRGALAKAPLLVAFSTHLDETTQLANIVLPISTNFEAWGDSEPAPGVYNLNQPSMQPLYQTQSFGDSLIAILASSKLNAPIPKISSFVDYIKSVWKKRTGAAGFEDRWVEYVANGGDWAKPRAPRATFTLASSASKVSTSEVPKSAGLSLLAFASVHFGDGSSANRPWMQEIPDPMTTAVWGSWVEIHPDTMAANGLKADSVVQVKGKYGTIEAPVYENKYIAQGLVAMPIGQGHDGFGRFADGVGANPLELLDPSNRGSFIVDGIELRNSITKEELVVTQGSDTEMDRGFIRSVATATLAAAGHKNGHGDDDSHGGGHHDPHALGPRETPKQMYQQMEHVQYRWGMSIDVNACTGCSACVTACYAENNVPVVGKEFASEGREMSWVRISRFFDGPEDSPVTGFAPMMCQHCGNAPCEPVCPVYATYHSDEGLNTMVYNRCVGTRYCSNNCSYKVRRFNWYDYKWPEPLTWQLNPDVTVRGVGVMEKCSFCIQRVREGENKAKDAGRHVKDGEIQPACASSCPADAISFGNLQDESSEVYEDSQSERGYKILDFELNTQPAITYLAKVTHEEPKKDDHGGHGDGH